jgi:hypothetical protein
MGVRRQTLRERITTDAREEGRADAWVVAECFVLNQATIRLHHVSARSVATGVTLLTSHFLAAAASSLIRRKRMLRGHAGITKVGVVFY